MSKTITLRLSTQEYKQILASAQAEHRPISNFITHVVLEKIANTFYADQEEMQQICTDESLIRRLKNGSKEAQERKKMPIKKNR